MIIVLNKNIHKLTFGAISPVTFVYFLLLLLFLKPEISKVTYLLL